MTTARAVLATWSAAMAETWSNRRGFWIQIGAMVANDTMWILFWLFFFQRFHSVRGWDFDDLIVLYSVLTITGGFVLGLLANSRLIGRLIADGELDAALSLPTPTLLYLLVRRVDATFVGDIFFGVGLFVLLADPTPQRIVLLLGCITVGVAIMAGFLVTVGSTAFFVGRNEAGDFGFHMLLLFSSYPIDLFNATARLFLYLVIPAGFVSGVPVRLFNEFDWRWAAATALMGGFFAWAGTTVFYRGLRRYASGSVWTVG